jgi:2-iminobutanoate/2-iminopropanoate deaminase
MKGQLQEVGTMRRAGDSLKKRHAWVLFAALGIGLLGCQQLSEDDEDEVEGKTVVVAAQEGLPFSLAVRADGLLFLSGQIGTLPGSLELVEGGIQAETRQTLENIRNTLEQVGATLDDVVKCTAFLADMSEWAAMNEVYREYFAVDPPARSAMGASGLALGARVEIECIAAAP